ncbi:hypothetical protein [Halobaculum lipolyticum]|uniref:Uncharacterized protein n=1 Tax=Halobaculum lipolyticum TaxID=3032001 RepID=A0ABD5WH61_9EURY|nr:hypothetical protein [Halobaculum sp. DT31]
MSGPGDPRRPVESVQNAAVEHALTAGESRRALALVGALDPLHDASGDDPALTALSTTLVAWLGLRERDPSFGAVTPSPPTPAAPPRPDRPDRHREGDVDDDDLGAERSENETTPPPATVGAAVACERFDVSPARSAALAGCSREAVERALADRSGTTPDR